MEEEIRVLIGSRLREERERLRFSQQAFAELGGVSMRAEQDWERGVSAPKADFLAVAVEHGVDVLYVLTGKRAQPAETAPMTDEETHTLMLLQNRGIYPDGRNCRIHLEGIALVLEYIREVKLDKPIALTDAELAKIAKFSPSESRAWVFHPVTLTPRPTGPTSQTLLVYRCKTPVSLAWQLGPFDISVPDRFDVSGWPTFPIKIRVEADGTEYSCQLDIALDHMDELARGKPLAVGSISLAQAQALIASDMAYANDLPPPN